MTVAAAFFATALPYALQAHVATSVDTSVILAQWANETAYGGPDWSPNNNPGNVGSYDGQPVATFPTLEIGVDAYIHTMMLDYYVGVRQAVGWMSQAQALGRSPWASSHYTSGGRPPGSELVAIIIDNDLVQYDTTPKGPAMQLTEAQTFVRACYLLCLIREPDAGGFAMWSNNLVNGTMSTNDVLAGIADSPEGAGVLAAKRRVLGLVP